jgi:hypothetical protein
MHACAPVVASVEAAMRAAVARIVRVIFSIHSVDVVRQPNMRRSAHALSSGGNTENQSRRQSRLDGSYCLKSGHS